MRKNIILRLLKETSEEELERSSSNLIKELNDQKIGSLDLLCLGSDNITFRLSQILIQSGIGNIVRVSPSYELLMQYKELAKGMGISNFRDYVSTALSHPGYTDCKLAVIHAEKEQLREYLEKDLENGEYVVLGVKNE
ncbi:MAG: hypothetical protein Q8Q31_05240 [Nanoarchaeota archaeon]|nr:hypothetical protein [Nanoarchaeota archaeon]